MCSSDLGTDEQKVHLSAILNGDEFRAFLKEAVAKHGVHRVLLLGGDEPKPKGPFADSLEILESGLLADSGIREIGVAGYPEGHPRISNLSEAFERKRRLTREQGLGMYVVTQFSFSPNRVVEYCAGLARSAPDVSVYAGVAGPTDPVALARYSLQREPSNVVGVHLYSFGGALKTASWMRELI